MSNKKKDILNELEGMIAVGTNTIAIKNLLKKLEKFSNHKAVEKLIVSHAYSIIGQNKKALLLLGRERPYHELKYISEDEIQIQAALARVLLYMGSFYVAKRILTNVSQVIKERNIANRKLKNDITNYYCQLYRATGDSDKMLYYAQKGVKSYSSDSSEWDLCKCLEIGALIKLSKYENAQSELIKYENEQKNSQWISVIYNLRMMFSICLGKKDFKIAKEILDQLKNLVDLKVESLNLGQYWLLEGKYNLAVNMPAKAKLAYKNALKIFNSFEYYALSISAKEGLGKSGEDIFKGIWAFDLLFHPSFYLERDCFSTSNETSCFSFQNDVITSMNYDVAKLYDSPEIIDLVSGIYLKNRELNILSEKQSLFLLAVIGSGEFGIDIYTLTDFIYRAEFFDPKYSLDRSRKLMSYLKKMGFNFKKKKDRIYYDSYRNVKIIMPRKGELPELILYVSANFYNFKRADIEELLNISNGTANRLISSWVDEGKVEVISKGKNSSYSFKGKKYEDSKVSC